MRRVNDIVGEIAVASNEQAQGLGQIRIGMEQIEGVTQQNTANAEQTASAAEELSSQAAQLRSTLSQFRLDDNRRSQSYAPAPRASSPRSERPKASFQVDDSIILDETEYGRY